MSSSSHPKEDLVKLLAKANSWNRQHRWPTVLVRVKDNEELDFFAQNNVDLDVGCTDRMLASLLREQPTYFHKCYKELFTD